VVGDKPRCIDALKLCERRGLQRFADRVRASSSTLVSQGNE
jgi:hypothetical protein